MKSSRSSRPSSSRSRRTEERPAPAGEQTVPLDPKEKALLGIFACQLVAASWISGGMIPLGLGSAAVLAVAAFVCAMLPRSFFPDYQPLRRLVRFPIFWLGLAFLLWGLVQTLNPATRYQLDPQGRFWFMERLEPISWLPSGVDTPYSRMNGWRMLMMHGMVWLSVCAAWVGLSRRRSGRLLLTVIAVNGLVTALVGIAGRLAPNGKLLWFVDSPKGGHFSSFIYRNHAGAFLNLALIVALGLAFWHAGRSERRMLRSSPAVIFALMAGLMLVSVMLTYSRGSAIVASLAILGAAALFIVRQIRGSRSIAGVVAAFLLAGLAGYGAYTLGADKTWARFAEFEKSDFGSGYSSRRQAALATWDMAQVKPWTGWGAGAFSHHFPAFQAKYPEIYGAAWNGRLFWQYAHNDPLQFLVESGIIGCVPLVLGGFFWAYRLARVRFWRSPWLLCLVAGGVLTLAHGYFDFLFYNPAILLTWCLIWPIGVQWREFEVRGAAPRG